MSLYQAFQTAARPQLRVFLLGCLFAAIYAAIVSAALPPTYSGAGYYYMTRYQSIKAPGSTVLPSTVIGRDERLR